MTQRLKSVALINLKHFLRRGNCTSILEFVHYAGENGDVTVNVVNAPKLYLVV